MRRFLLPFAGRYLALVLSVLAVAGLSVGLAAGGGESTPVLALLACAVGLSAVGVRDMTQTRHAILRNYPIIGHLRFMAESIRPEMRQYFFEAEDDGAAHRAASSGL